MFMQTILGFVIAAIGYQGHGAGAPPAELEAMKKLSYMVGKWEGSGWAMGRDGKRTNVEGGETVQMKLQGRALLVEGLFRHSDPGTPGDGVVGHETLAILTYDVPTKTYKFQTHTFNGAPGNHELKLIEGGWQWEIKQPNGPLIRFTAKFDATTWTEYGEIIMEGREAMKFLEFTLKKAGSASIKRP